MEDASRHGGDRRYRLNGGVFPDDKAPSVMNGRERRGNTPSPLLPQVNVECEAVRHHGVTARPPLDRPVLFDVPPIQQDLACQIWASGRGQELRDEVANNAVPLAHKVEPVTAKQRLRKTALLAPVHCSHGHPRLFASVTFFSAPKTMGLKLKSSRCRRTGLESSLKEVPHGGDGSAWPAPAEILKVFVY